MEPLTSTNRGKESGTIFRIIKSMAIHCQDCCTCLVEVYCHGGGAHHIGHTAAVLPKVGQLHTGNGEAAPDPCVPVTLNDGHIVT